MHIRCLRHSTGSARAAADYLVGERDSAGRVRPGVEILRGNPDHVAAVADPLEFEHKHTSVVIAWAPEDRPTDEQIGAVLDEFEKTAWTGTRAGPLRLDGGPAPRARRRGPRARPRRPLRPGDRPQPEHRPAGLAEDLRPAARRLQPPARLEPPGRSGARPGAPARPSRLPGGGEAADRPQARSRPARTDPRLPPAAGRTRRGAEPRRRGRRPGGGRLRGAPPGQGLRDRPRSRQRDAVAAERSAV